MKLSPLATLAIFVGILLGGLAGAGAIFNHLYPAGSAKIDVVDQKVDGLTKNDERQDANLRDHGSKLSDLEKRTSANEKGLESVQRDVGVLQTQQKQTQEQIASSQAHIAALKDMTDKQADSIKSLEHDNAELRKSQETLKKETQEKLDKMRKMQETQDERIKRMERLLGLEAEN